MDGIGQPRRPAMAADRDRSQSAIRRDNFRIDTDEVQNLSRPQVEGSTADRASRGDGEGVARSPNPRHIHLNRTRRLILLYSI